ncbi:LysR family transcriptional regulator [Sphingopyxis witflariensis]|uniref:LysR family transcriptional regulator n=1 Tax=Sphingopyxis witflariensis TaxID=173675 RepID=A0A246K5B7_9SPHN|nr:LysR family transcriptional regulator [Sphingopyxis witflariensis]OWR01177.1 LysR family transcriptional regulator [Sphingopyxis witflariensis]
MHKPLAPVGAIADKEVSFRALRVFSEIMRTGSATAAGKQLSLSQPAVSRLIAQLEANVGFDLFYRDRGKLVPTADGIKLLQEVELTLASLDRFNSMVRDIAGYSAGTVRVVAPPSFAEGVLPDIVSQFRERFPGVEFSIDSRSVETARSMIAMRYVDCGFVKLPADESDLAVEQVVSSGSVCVLHEDHPLAALETITPADIGDHALILLGAGRHWRTQVDAAFASFGLRPSVAIETHTHGSACALAARGNGMAILNALLVKPYLHKPLVARPFAPPILHQYAFAVSNVSRPSRLTLEFKAEVLRYFAG